MKLVELRMNGAYLMKLSKKMMNAGAIKKDSQLFRCPLCTAAMELVDEARLVCAENHSFDLSKQGYVNLAPQAHTTKYDRTLFEARTTIIDSGFFNPLLERLTVLLSEQLQDKESTVVMDAGCGEGSHLSTLLTHLPGHVVGVGIDLAKEGIVAAAKDHPGHIWAVGDLANCPFQEEQFDVVLNILSPANYGEFTRLLKAGGLFIKVIPEEGYLKELRAVFYDGAERPNETNATERITELFDSIETERLTYEFPLDSTLLSKLIQMTPLTWGASSEKVERALTSDIASITIDYKILIGIKAKG